MAIITSNDIRDLLWPGLKSLFGLLDSYPDEWKEFCESHTSNQAMERDVEMKYLSVATVKSQGQAHSSDSMGQRFITTYIPETISQTFSITKEAIKDNPLATHYDWQKSLVASIESISDSMAIEFAKWLHARAVEFDFEEEINHTIEEQFAQFKKEFYK